MPRPSTTKPSPRQNELMRFISAYRGDNNKGPTLKEMAAALKIGISTAAQLLNRLKEKGLAVTVPGSPRNVLVLGDESTTTEERSRSQDEEPR